MPADSFVRIWKFIARPNICGTPRLREAATTLEAMRGHAKYRNQASQKGICSPKV